MEYFKRNLIYKQLVFYPYGFGAHCMNTLTFDIGKLSKVSKVIKEYLYLSKTVNIVCFIRKIYEKICDENLGGFCSIVRYSPSQWTNVNSMFHSLRKVSPVFTLFQHVSPQMYDSSQHIFHLLAPCQNGSDTGHSSLFRTPRNLHKTYRSHLCMRSKLLIRHLYDSRHPCFIPDFSFTFCSNGRLK